ncbi:hypothetical protein [Micromonospora sp. NPDC003816]|uniref:hypothetical protein n=1 Tax=Micromonospora sp. NPDC003816 TaxID=3364224 RepID=UPI0036A5E264
MISVLPAVTFVGSDAGAGAATPGEAKPTATVTMVASSTVVRRDRCWTSTISPLHRWTRPFTRVVVAATTVGLDLTSPRGHGLREPPIRLWDHP